MQNRAKNGRAPTTLAKRAGRLTSIAAALALVSGAAAAEPAPGAATPSELRDLEVKVWTADDHDLPQLERAVVRLIQETPRSAFGHHLLAHVMVRQFSKDPGDLYLLKQASDIAQQAVDLEPNEPVGYVALADILDLMGNPDRALRLLDDTEKAGMRPNWRFDFTRARLVSDSAPGTKVLGLMEHALSFPDAEPRIVAPYVVALLQADATGEQLVARLEEWNKRFPSSLFRLTEAIALADLGKAKTAHTYYQQILSADPLNKEAAVNDAILQYRDLGDSERAAAQLETVLAQHPADLAASVRAMIGAHLGAAYVHKKKWDRAAVAFTDAMTADPSNSGLLDFVTRTYREAKEPTQLVALIHRLNDVGPGTGVLYALLGETLSESLNQHDAALKAFVNAITLDPNRSDYYNGMGLAYYRKKSYREALKLFGAASEVDPNDATARYNSACVLSLMGRRDEALNSLAEALTLDPRLTQSARGDADFATLQDSAQFQGLTRDTAH